MEWTFRSDQPIYAQLSRHLSAAIVTGYYTPGQRLPSVRDIALDAGVNPNTVQRALAELERQKLVHSERTSGRFVTSDARVLTGLHEALSKKSFDEFADSLRKIGLSDAEIKDSVSKWIKEL